MINHLNRPRCRPRICGPKPMQPQRVWFDPHVERCVGYEGVPDTRAIYRVLGLLSSTWVTSYEDFIKMLQHNPTPVFRLLQEALRTMQASGQILRGHIETWGAETWVVFDRVPPPKIERCKRP